MLQDLISKAGYAVSGLVTSLGLMNINTWAVLFGMVLGFATFVLNWIYKHKMYELTKQQLEELKTGQ